VVGVERAQVARLCESRAAVRGGVGSGGGANDSGREGAPGAPPLVRGGRASHPGGVRRVGSSATGTPPPNSRGTPILVVSSSARLLHQLRPRAQSAPLTRTE